MVTILAISVFACYPEPKPFDFSEELTKPDYSSLRRRVPPAHNERHVKVFQAYLETGTPPPNHQDSLKRTYQKLFEKEKRWLMAVLHNRLVDHFSKKPGRKKLTSKETVRRIMFLASLEYGEISMLLAFALRDREIPIIEMKTILWYFGRAKRFEHVPLLKRYILYPNQTISLFAAKACLMLEAEACLPEMQRAGAMFDDKSVKELLIRYATELASKTQ